MTEGKLKSAKEEAKSVLASSVCYSPTLYKALAKRFNVEED